jgi:diguanylate cyclase (GGDEF)-like protein/PAS domain S-box-containing protein
MLPVEGFSMRHRAESRFPESEKLWATAIDALPGIFYLFDIRGNFMLWNRQLEIVSGYSYEEVEQAHPLDFFRGDDVAVITECIAKTLATGYSDSSADFVSKDGTKTPFHFTGKMVTIDGTQCVVGMGVDTSERKRAEDALRNSETLFRAVAENAQDITSILASDGRILYQSPSVEEILGYMPDESIGLSMFDFVHPDDVVETRWRFEARVSGGPTKNAVPADFRFRHKDGTWRSLSFRASMFIPAIGGIILTSRDVTEQRAAEKRVHHLALYDGLTGLANRHLLQDRIVMAFARSQLYGNAGALMFLDLDRFKVVNDSLGHVVGDAVLEAVAKRLSARVRASDTLARQGGDEFVILLGRADTALQAGYVARGIHQALVEPFFIGAHEIHVTASIGICMYPADGVDASTLVRHADIAMYEAKNSGRNTTRFFTEEMNARVESDLEMENDLRHAIDRGEFELHYQPILSVASGKVLGFEALIRWNHPEHGLVMPQSFIRVAEETGLIEQIGTWVFGEACRQLKIWQEAGHPRLGMAVNVSANQLRRGNLLEIVSDVLRDTALDAATLDIELTESAVMDYERATVTLRLLSDLGIGLSLDDFGTGFSSLTHLKRMHIDKLKIDQTFVSGMTEDGDDAAIVNAILALGKATRIAVLAEGVETRAQFDLLRAAGCDQVQGFLFAPGLPAEEAARYLDSDPYEPLAIK